MVPMNESQTRFILTGFLDMHRRMAEMEAMLAQCPKPSVFSQYVHDLSPTESKVVQDYFARLRATMLDWLHESGIALEVRQTSLGWALQCGITFLHIAVAEMSPDRLRGYGHLDPEAATQVVKMQDGIRRLVERVAAYLRQGLGHDLSGRLMRLEATHADMGTLPLLEKVMTRWGLVEFRPQLDLIVRRLETPQFEIAVFGRVSSGKSSLLNHIVGTDVLPVGVTPITAVPTRLVRGDQRAACIAFAEEASRTVPVADLRLYASEEGNPGNRKHVTSILVQLPTPRLREGIVLVDTPGTGSLAQSGSAETFAYLPHCDLGVVLIDAASALTADDLDLLRLLYEAGIPAQVLLSKADLLTPGDRQRAAGYIHDHVRQELSLDLPVYPVSTVGAEEQLLGQWFEQALEPLLARHQTLSAASMHRKIAHLHEAVVATLQTLLARHLGETPSSFPASSQTTRMPVDTDLVRRCLDQADDAIRKTQVQCREWTIDGPALLEIVLQDAARAASEHRQPSAESQAVEATENPVLVSLGRLHLQRSQMALELASSLRKTLTGVLESLRDTVLANQMDTSSVQNSALRGLPVPDLLALSAAPQWVRPWWAALFPGLALGAIKRSMRRHIGPLIREQLALYDKQLRAWLTASVTQLVQLYEAQAEIIREQVHRFTVKADGAGSPEDAGSMQADLLELTVQGGSPTS